MESIVGWLVFFPKSKYYMVLVSLNLLVTSSQPLSVEVEVHRNFL